MSVTYNKLWKLLIDKNMNKKDLHIISGLSLSTITKLKKNENVNVNVLEKICRSLNCNIGDIVDLLEEQK